MSVFENTHETCIEWRERTKKAEERLMKEEEEEVAINDR